MRGVEGDARTLGSSLRSSYLCAAAATAAAGSLQSEPVSGPHNFHLVCKPPPSEPQAPRAAPVQSPPPPSAASNSSGAGAAASSSSSRAFNPAYQPPAHAEHTPASTSQPAAPPARTVPISADNEELLSFLEGLDAFMQNMDHAPPSPPHQQEHHVEQGQQQQVNWSLQQNANLGSRDARCLCVHLVCVACGHLFCALIAYGATRTRGSQRACV